MLERHVVEGEPSQIGKGLGMRRPAYSTAMPAQDETKRSGRSTHGSLACTNLLTAPKSMSDASGNFFSAPITLPMSFFVCAPVS